MEQEEPMTVLSEAFGHIRVATNELLVARNDAGALEMGLLALDLEAILEELDVEPVYIAPGLTASESLAAAAELLDRDRSHVPLGVWSRLQALVVQVG